MNDFRYKILTMVVCVMALASCMQDTPYHHFEETPLTASPVWPDDETGAEQVMGWAKDDTLHFSVDTLKESGKYTMTLEVRTSDLYPYRNLSLMVEEKVVPPLTYFPKGKDVASGEARIKAARRYAVELEPRDEDGTFKGLGLSRHDLSKVLTCQYLRHGDSIHIKVYHRMRRQVLPGVTDVGIKLSLIP